MRDAADKLRVAVIGVGHLGQHHARLYASLPGCRLVAVVDIDAPRAAEIARKHGVEHFEDWRSLAGKVDAVSVAVPTESHCEVGSFYLEAGAAVLVEKPITPTLSEADRLINAARNAGTLLGVGHTERFNPAVEALAARARDPRFIEAHRLGSLAPRSLDIDVVLDLMVHDIDVALHLVGGPVSSVEAVGVSALTPRVDIANARLVFKSGCVANLTASRISSVRTRKIRVFQHNSYLSCDTTERSLRHFHLEMTASGPSIVQDSVTTGDEEPLRRELEAFVTAARGGSSFPVTGEAGREALEIALTVMKKIEESPTGDPR